MKNVKNFLTGLIFFYLVGCSATTTFTSYPNKISPCRGHLNSATPPDYVKIFSSERSSKDKILYNLEHGRLAQVFGQTEISKEDFTLAIATIRENEQKATVSASGIGANLASLATNDNAIPYKEEGYERILLHHYQAQNYLLNSDLEGAGIEFRWANTEQEESLKRHEKDLQTATEKATEKNINNPAENTAYQQQYAQLNEIAGKVKNSFQNAYSYYLSGLVYELQGERNDAYIDYKKALEIYPENTYLQRDVIRLAKLMDMTDDLVGLSERFPDALSRLPSEVDRDLDAELILFFEDGFVPAREEVKLSLPIPTGIVSVALPIYRTTWTNYNPLKVKIEQSSVAGETEPLCDVRVLAIKSLQEKMPIILTRQAIRSAAKAVAQKAAKDQFGFAGQLGVMAYSVVSESADLRSWLTLPENVQMLRLQVPSGKHNLILQQPSSQTCTTLDVDLKKNGKTIVYVTKTGEQYHTSSVSF